MSYPRKAPMKYLNGAPPYILAVYDSGPKTNDRYTVVFGWPFWDKRHPNVFPYLGFNEVPTSPNMGVSMWGELQGSRSGLGKLIAWESLPEHLRKHVIARANYPDPVLIMSLVKMPKSESGLKTLWAFKESDEAVGYWGDVTFEKKSEGVAYAEENLIILID